jgi:uncharacterized protein YbjT (DUF2867 family)
MNNTSAPIAVIGATGQQGGAVAAALLDRGAPVRAIARDADKARDLAERGAGVAVVDLDDGAALRRAFDGVAAVFAMTTMTGPSGTEGEVAHGRAIADAARDAQITHLVYSSVGGAERDTGIPHFESKWRVEQYLHAIGVPTVVIRPTFFMDNFLSLFTPSARDGQVVLRAPFAPGVPLQMVAVEDVGKAAATALLDAAAVLEGAVEIAGDERTPEAIADAFGAHLGLPAHFEQLPLDAIDDDDAQAMFRWFTELPAYEADMKRTRALVGDVTDFPTFVARHPVSAS